MKSYLLVLFSLLSISIANAEDFCEGTAQKHYSRAEQKGSDVEVSLSNEAFRPYRDLEKFKISGKETSTIVVHDISLESFMKNSKLAVDVFASLVFGRREFDGEYDIAWSYADSFFRSLKCR